MKLTLKIINKYSYKLVALLILFLLFGCTSKGKKVESEDNFIASFTRDTKEETNLVVDSLLNTYQYTGNQLGHLYFQKGAYYSNKQWDKEAVKFYGKALSLFKENQNLPQLAKTHMLLGSTLIFLGKQEQATDHLLKSLELSKKLNDKTTEANVYNALAHVYFASKDYKNAIQYTLKSIEIQTARKDSMGLSSTYNNLAVIYKNTMNLEGALSYNLLSLELNKKMNNPSAIAKSYNNLGLVFELKSQEKKAINYYKKAVKLNQEDSILNTSPLQNLAHLYFKNNQIDSSIQYYKRALKVEQSNSKPLSLKKVYEGLIKTSLKKNDLSSLTHYYHNIDSINVVIAKLENEENLYAIENQYKLLNGEKELEQEIKNNTKNKIIFLIILGFIIITVLFIYQKNKNSKLKLAQEKLMLEQRVLRSQMNPHFIFNALSAIQNSLMDNDPLKSASYLSKFAKLIRQNFDFINQKTVTLAEEIDALKNYMETQMLRFKNKFDYVINLDDKIDPDKIEIPPLLIQPFIENSIEHGFKNKLDKGEIAISIYEDNGRIHYEIKDNGKGFIKTENNTKDHAIDIFKKRMRLFGNKEESFSIHSNEKGTLVQFNLSKHENTIS